MIKIDMYIDDHEEIYGKFNECDMSENVHIFDTRKFRLYFESASMRRNFNDTVTN